MFDFSSIKSVLQDLGYPINDCGNYWQTKALFRGGTDDTSVAIYPHKNLVIDFVRGERFSIDMLIALTLKLESEEKAKEWLKNKEIILPLFDDLKPSIEIKKTLDLDNLKNLKDNHEYFIKRGISEKILQEFRGGLWPKEIKGKMSDRYVFPIFNSKGELVGLTGRDVTNLKKIKWKHGGDKQTWCWPLFLSSKVIKEKKEVIIVESPGDTLSLFEAGIRNIICIFGVEMSLAVLNYLIKINPSKIYISLNDDSNLGKKVEAGNLAAEKLQRRLWKYFDKKQIKIHFPENNDINEMLTKHGKESIIKWYSKKDQKYNG